MSNAHTASPAASFLRNEYEVAIDAVREGYAIEDAAAWGCTVEEAHAAADRRAARASRFPVVVITHECPACEALPF